MGKTLLAIVALSCSSCGLLEPEEFWCAKTAYWSLTDSVVAVDSVGTWRAAEAEPDSTVIEWSVDGECLHNEEGT
jgi:hypothetical protein